MSYCFYFLNLLLSGNEADGKPLNLEPHRPSVQPVGLDTVVAAWAAAGRACRH